MSIKFSRVTCIHGTENDVSLFFDDVSFKLEGFDALETCHNSVLNYFGFIRHAPAAMFNKHSKCIHNDIPLSFIKIDGARMGGKIMSLLRLFKLRHPLIETISLNELRKFNARRQFYSLFLMDDECEHMFTFFG